MNENNPVALDTLIQGKIENDTEFQNSIKDLSDDEKSSALESKRIEILKAEAPTWLEKATKNEELANNYKTRAEKAEGAIKDKKSPDTRTDSVPQLSTKDYLALTEAKIPSDDVDEVLEYAAFKKITVADALKSSVVKASLAEKAENRRTAAASQTRTTRQTTKVDGATIIQNAKEKGESAIPEKGTNEAEELYWARRGGKR